MRCVFLFLLSDAKEVQSFIFILFLFSFRGEGAVAEILAAHYVGAAILHLPAITVWMVQKRQFMGYKQQHTLVRTLNSPATNNLLR